MVVQGEVIAELVNRARLSAIREPRATSVAHHDLNFITSNPRSEYFSVSTCIHTSEFKANDTQGHDVAVALYIRIFVNNRVYCTSTYHKSI